MRFADKIYVACVQTLDNALKTASRVSFLRLLSNAGY